MDNIFNMRKIVRFVMFVCLILTACGKNAGQKEAGKGREIKFSYAENISVRQHKDYKVVTLANPWKAGETLHTYILIDRKDSAKCETLPEGTVIYTPVRRAVLFASPHVALARMIGALDNVAGVADKEFIMDSDAKARIARGTITDCGKSLSPDMERIIDTRPDALFLSPFENSGGYGKVANTGAPIVECAEYMETSALGRAEWMRFYGMLLGKEHEADSLFEVVCKEYNNLKRQAGKSGRGLKIITERLTGSTWYVPGGRSSAGRLIADANAGYAFADDSHSGSLALSFETVLDKAGDADVWVFCHGGTTQASYGNLLAEYRGYASMKAFKDKNVWYVENEKVPYFEEISFRPDYLLRDYIILTHPGLKVGKTRYFTKMT